MNTIMHFEIREIIVNNSTLSQAEATKLAGSLDGYIETEINNGINCAIVPIKAEIADINKMLFRLGLK